MDPTGKVHYAPSHADFVEKYGKTRKIDSLKDAQADMYKKRWIRIWYMPRGSSMAVYFSTIPTYSQLKDLQELVTDTLKMDDHIEVEYAGHWSSIMTVEDFADASSWAQLALAGSLTRESLLTEMPHVPVGKPTTIPGTGVMLHTLADFRFERDPRTKSRQGELLKALQGGGVIWKTGKGQWVRARIVKGELEVTTVPEGVKGTTIPDGWERVIRSGFGE